MVGYLLIRDKVVGLKPDDYLQHDLLEHGFFIFALDFSKEVYEIFFTNVHCQLIVKIVG